MVGTSVNTHPELTKIQNSAEEYFRIEGGCGGRPVLALLLLWTTPSVFCGYIHIGGGCIRRINPS